MSRLFGLSRQASEYVRRRMIGATRRADAQIEQDSEESSDYARARRSVLRRLADYLFGRSNKEFPPGSWQTESEPPPIINPSQPGPPPVWLPYPHTLPLPPGPSLPPLPGSGSGMQPPRPPRRPATAAGDDDDDRGDGFGPELGSKEIEILGRDASYDPDDWKVVMDQMRLTPGSSNVYGYYFEFEARTSGILYVTFLASWRSEKRSGPGPTYAYYGVPARKYHEFRKAAASSAGNAVWDYLRIRGTIWGHQHTYRLIQAGGDYVPRKATQGGYRTRHVPALGTGRRSFVRSTLPEERFNARGTPYRAQPDRGQPNRGEPNDSGFF